MSGYDAGKASITLDRPGAILRGATIRGDALRVTAEGVTIEDCTIRTVKRRLDWDAPAALLIGALVGAVLVRWGR